MPPRKITDEQAAEMQVLRDGGMQLREIGLRYDVAAKTVLYWTETPEDRKRKPKHRTAAFTDETAEMWGLYSRGDMTVVQIAAHYGIATNSVYDRINRWRSQLPETPREVVIARELEQLEEVRRLLLAIARNEEGYVTTSDRINAIRAVFSSMERVAKMMGLDASDVLDERRVRIAERQADLLTQAFRVFVVALGLDPDTIAVQNAMANALNAVSTEDAA